MISQKGTGFISEILTHFPKVLIKRMKMEIYLDIKSCQGRIK
jgi:hypothetical protein